MSNGVDPPTFNTLCKLFNVLFLSLSRSDFRSVEPTQRETGRVRPCPSVCDGVDPPTFYILCKHFNEFFEVSRDRTSAQSNRHKERRVVSVRVRPCPMESIRQHFTPSVNTSVYFSKSLAIGLPVSRTVAYPRRSDSVRVYWTCMKKSDGKGILS